MISMEQPLKEMEVNTVCMIDNEKWKPIKNYESLYEVSDLGNIKSLKRNVILKVRNDKNGYLVINLCKKGKTKTFKVHRLVAHEFIDNPLNKKEINHKDGNKQNNRVNNLEWCSSKENQIHAYKMHLQIPTYKKVFQYDLNNNFIREWKSMKLASEELKIHHGDICQCCKQRRKTAGGFIWRYSNEINKRNVK